MKTEATRNPDISYHAYLLKIWLEHDREITTNSWRFSLEDAHTGMRRGFTDLEALLIYLEDLTRQHPGTAE